MKKTTILAALLGASFAAAAGNPLLDSLREEMENNSKSRRVAPMNSTSPAANEEVSRPGRDDVIGTPVFNLKGLNLKMTREDVKKVLPNTNYIAEKVVDGKEVGSYTCGSEVQRKPGVVPVACNFTLAGVEIRNMVIQFWGERPVRVTMYFNNYRDQRYDNEGNLARLQDGLDAKYAEQANGEPRLGSRNAGDGVWTAKNERIAFDRSATFSTKMDILELMNHNLSANMVESHNRAEANREIQDRQNRANKAAKDL
jgi:hypothetical protein